MIKVESILKWTVEGSLLKKLKMVRAQILSKNPDAVAISDKDLHITLASGSGWQKLKSRIKAKDVDEPEFSIDIDPSAKVIEKAGSKSWYVKLKNQQDWKEYVMDSLQGTYDSGRVYHISIANLTGNKMDSVAMVEDRDYKNEHKKFQSSTKSKKYRAEQNQYNKRKATKVEETRNYRKEYDNYHAQPEQRERNAARLRARRLMVKSGKVEKFDKMDVHHKDNNPLNNDKDNLAVTTQTWNRTEPRLRKEEVKIKESIKLSDQGLVRPYFDGRFKDMNMKLAFTTHSKTDHLDREGTFNSAKLIGTFKKFHKKYKNKIPEIPRIPEDDLANDEDRHYIYDKKSNYSILFFIKAGTPKDTFIVMTAYPNRPKIVGSMTKWEV